VRLATRLLALCARRFVAALNVRRRKSAMAEAKYYRTRDTIEKILKKRGIPKKEMGKYIADAGKRGFELVEPAPPGGRMLDGVPTVTEVDVEIPPSTEPRILKTILEGNGHGPAQNPELPESALAGAVSTKGKAKKEKPPKEPKTPRITIASIMRQLLLAGKTNEETWEEAKKVLPDKVGDRQRNHPAWYRSKLRSEGKLSPKQKSE